MDGELKWNDLYDRIKIVNTIIDNKQVFIFKLICHI